MYLASWVGGTALLVHSLVAVDRPLEEHDRVTHVEEVRGVRAQLGPQPAQTCIALGRDGGGMDGRLQRHAGGPQW